jgi:hypothetical protein
MPPTMWGAPPKTSRRRLSLGSTEVELRSLRWGPEGRGRPEALSNLLLGGMGMRVLGPAAGFIEYVQPKQALRGLCL